MPVFKKGKFNLNLGFVSIGGEFEEDDRQCAWELYCELISRVAVSGKIDDLEKLDFSGEVYAESFESLYRFFQEARQIMRRYPVGTINFDQAPQDHLGFFIASLLEVIIRPFLEKWRAGYRYWWDNQSDKSLSPFLRPIQYARCDELLADWTAVRKFCRDTAKELAETYSLKDVTEIMPKGLRAKWIEETRLVTNET
jgi:hypothetical protein